VTYLKNEGQVEDFSPNLEPYGKLASIWDDYSGWYLPGYRGFLFAAANHFGITLTSVLDLACGTGLQARSLATMAELVIGLDISDPMLRVAKSRTTSNNIRYVQGDFLDFDLKERFDAVLCASDSLNYVKNLGELQKVFACVFRHLHPGGLFIFDVVDQRHFQMMASTKTVASVNGEGFETCYFYDADKRVSESRVLLEGGAIERHRRIPIDEMDVEISAYKADLEIIERFPQRIWLFPSGRVFYVLRQGSTI
jgi:SAM-dependent methyltransferase